MDSPEQSPVALGTKIGEYEITARIGEGGMGTVYAGVHPVIGKRVAIKILKLASDATAQDRFIQEARVVNAIGHPNIVDIFAFDQLPDKRPFFVMEYLQGETLKARLKRMPPLTYEESFHIIRQLSSALRAAHETGIVHRDLKPENIMLVETKNQRAVKLLDFGVAKLLDPDGLNRTGTQQTIGTPAFMSPEQCLAASVDARADIYSLGVMMFLIFTGRLPFTGGAEYFVLNGHVAKAPPRPSALVAIPERLEALILKCLEKAPAARPQAVDEIVAALDQLDATIPAEVMKGPIPAQSLVVDERATLTAKEKSIRAASPALAERVAPRRPSRSALALAVVLTTAAGAVLVHRFRSHNQTPPPEASESRSRAVSNPAGIAIDNDSLLVNHERGYTRDSAQLAIAPTSEPPAPSGDLRVETTARKAVWRVDGQSVGDGSGVLVLAKLRPGPHRVSIAADGFRPREETIEVAAGGRTSVDWELVEYLSQTKRSRRPVALPRVKAAPAPSDPMNATVAAPATATPAKNVSLPELRRPF